MSGVIDLVQMLKKTGIPMNQGIIDAILSTEPSDLRIFHWKVSGRTTRAISCD